MEESGAFDRDADEGPTERSRRMNEATENILARTLLSGPLRIRSIRTRGSKDQATAVEMGYDSVEQLAIDELGEVCRRQDEAIRLLAEGLIDEDREPILAILDGRNS